MVRGIPWKVTAHIFTPLPSITLYAVSLRLPFGTPSEICVGNPVGCAVKQVLKGRRLYCRCAADFLMNGRFLLRRTDVKSNLENKKRFAPLPFFEQAEESFLYKNKKIRAPRFEIPPQTLLLQLTRLRHPHGTQKGSLSAAAFLP